MMNVDALSPYVIPEENWQTCDAQVLKQANDAVSRGVPVSIAYKDGIWYAIDTGNTPEVICSAGMYIKLNSIKPLPYDKKVYSPIEYTSTIQRLTEMILACSELVVQYNSQAYNRCQAYR